MFSFVRHISVDVIMVVNAFRILCLCLHTLAECVFLCSCFVCNVLSAQVRIKGEGADPRGRDRQAPKFNLFRVVQFNVSWFQKFQN